MNWIVGIAVALVLLYVLTRRRAAPRP